MQLVLPSGVLARAALVMALAKTASAFSALPPTSPLRPNLASSGLRPRASVSMVRRRLMGSEPALPDPCPASVPAPNSHHVLRVRGYVDFFLNTRYRLHAAGCSKCVRPLFVLACACGPGFCWCAECEWACCHKQGPNGAQMSLTAAKKGMLVALGQKKAAAPPTLMEQATSTVSALAATSTTTFAAVSAALLASAQGDRSRKQASVHVRMCPYMRMPVCSYVNEVDADGEHPQGYPSFWQHRHSCR